MPGCVQRVYYFPHRQFDFEQPIPSSPLSSLFHATRYYINDIHTCMHVCTSDAHNRRNVLKREKCKFASWSVELKGIIGCWGRSNLPRQLLQVIENCTRNVCTRYHQHRATSGSLHFAREPAPIPTGIAINVVSFGIRLFPIVAD